MPGVTTIGQVLVNEALPTEMRDPTRTLGADEIEALLARLAKERPDAYREVSARLMRLGNEAAWESGATLRLSDIEPTFDRSSITMAVDQAEDRIRRMPGVTPEQRTAMLTKVYEEATKRMQDRAYETALAKRNPFAVQVKSKARGNPPQLAAMIATPGTYADSKGRTVPMFIRHSFAEGLSPAEYWAGSFGARTGVVSTKLATQKGGYLGKLLSQASIEEVVTEDDCGGAYGMPVKADDKDNIGCVLQKPAGGYDAGTVITKSVLSDLADRKVDTIVVRSPTTCGAKSGVCSHCCGIRETGGFPPIGYNLGLNAASALSERITQGALNCLAEGTLVRMADGSVKPIEKVEPGEMVMGSSAMGDPKPSRVVQRYDNGWQPCVRTYISRYPGMDIYGEAYARPCEHRETVELVSTEIHGVLSNYPSPYSVTEIGKLARESWRAKSAGEYGKAPLVHVKTYFDTPKHDDTFDFDYQWEGRASDIIGQESVGVRHVYDLEIDHPDHLFILANGLIVHNTKHSGKAIKGVGDYSGFEHIKAMATVPKKYLDAATVSPVDGIVDKVENAPQGGQYIYIGETRLYAPAGRAATVKAGDSVEAGDQISEGMLNPADVVRYKGIGEGRRYFSERFTQMMRDSGYKVNRRNVEAIARSLVDSVEVDDEDSEGQMLPGDVVSYTRWSFGYRPKDTSTRQSPGQSVGQYLQEPVLHYTVGTKISNRMADDMSKYGVKSVLTDKAPVGVSPVMQSVVETTGATDDWMARLGTTYLKTRLVEDAQHGADSHVHGVNPLPGIAKGTEFGTLSRNLSGGFTY